MGWRIVEVKTDENVKLYLNNLMVKRITEKILININEIDTLIFHNSRTNLSIRLINALSKNNVNVIIMDSMHEPNSYIVPINGHHNSLKILHKQLSWTNQYKGLLWKNIIENKINNQNKLLKKLNIKNYEKLISLQDSVKKFDISNREGHASKIYWHSLFGINFLRDQKCINNSKINSMLNYGYAIIRSLVIKSIIKKGLDSRISLFHKSFTNFFALASDLMEPFRQLVDLVVWKNRECLFFNINIREKLIDILELKVKVDTLKFNLNMAIDKVVDKIISNKGWAWVDLWE